MSAHRAAFRLTIVLAVTAALGQPPAGQNSRISGTVVNALSGQPLSHTQVAVGLPQNDAAQAMMTAEDGRFAFENLRAGKYWLAAEHKGFARQAFDEHEGFSTSRMSQFVARGSCSFAEQLIMAIKGPTCRHRREAMIWAVTDSADCVRELILWSCPHSPGTRSM